MLDTTSAPVRLAQVGVGYWGKNLLRNFHALPDAEVVAVCDRSPEVRASVERTYPGVQALTDMAAVVARPDIDAVVVAVETPEHFGVAHAALTAGKHVFVEKPLAATVAEAERLVELAERNGRTLMVGHLLRYHPAYQYVEAQVRAGTLGEVYYLYSTRVNLGIVRRHENAFASLAPHDLAVARALLPGRPVTIAAQGQAFLQPGVEDVVFATLHFDGGQMAHLHASWLDPHKTRRLTVVGSDRMIVLDDTASREKVRLYDNSAKLRPGEGLNYTSWAEALAIRTGDITLPKIDATEPLTEECRHFVACIRTGATPRTDGHDGLAVVRLLDAAHRSLKNGGQAIPLHS